MKRLCNKIQAQKKAYDSLYAVAARRTSHVIRRRGIVTPSPGIPIYRVIKQKKKLALCVFFVLHNNREPLNDRDERKNK